MGVSRLHRYGALALLALLLGSGCASRRPLPERLRVSGLEELRARMQQAASKLQSYSAEVRITYFGPEGRVRATASLLTARPASLRYDVLGPHGGAVSAFATDGNELEALDLGHSTFDYGPATADNIDRLLPFAPLGLSPAGWVSLLFGEISPPASAELSYDDRSGRFVMRWMTGKSERRVEVDPESSRPTRAEALSGSKVISDVLIDERDDTGLPTSLRIRVPDAKIDVEAKIRDVAANPEASPSLFVIEQPAGVTSRYLGGSGP
jgi:outer membrane lipoprotein-sorting protein